MIRGLGWVLLVARAFWSERHYVPTVPPMRYDAAKRAAWQEMVDGGRRVG